MAEVVPMTVERQPGGDAGGVQLDLGPEMASAARRDGGSIRRHDARCDVPGLARVELLRSSATEGTRHFDPGLARVRALALFCHRRLSACASLRGGSIAPVHEAGSAGGHCASA
jgi:hypothetical protein